jgi:alkylation response protein AidB-like acyl-CoA dehydrogenase
MILGSEEDLFRDSVRKFVEREMRTERMRAWAKSAEFPEELYRKWAEMGWLGIGLPEEMGGSAGDPLQMLILAEELARYGFDITGAYSTALFLGMTLAKHGTAAQRDAYLPQLMEGRLHLSTAITEPNTGSDISGVRCKAARGGGGWVISGEKVFCSGAHLPSTLILVTTRTSVDTDNARKGLTILLVPNDTPGLRISRMDTVGRKIFGTNQLHFDNVRVPANALLGAEDEAWKILSGSLDLERLFIAGGYVGNAQSALDLAVQYAKDRVQFGKPIGKYQAVSHALVEMRLRIDAARHMAYHAAELLKRGLPCRAEASMAKLAASEALVHATNQGMQILGGYGYTTEMEMERWFRDARVTTLLGGSSEIQRNIIAHEMGL